MGIKRINHFITSSGDEERLLRLDAIILALDNLLLASPLTLEYSIDSGQSIVRQKYRSILEITASIEALDKMRSRILSRNQPRIFQLLPIGGHR